MPLLPLPVDGSDIAGGDLPVSDVEDVLAAMPAFLRSDAPAEVRDAIAEAIAAIMIAYQDRASYAAAQSDLLRAIGPELAEICSEFGVFKQTDEQDEPLRARALAIPELVTPHAILDTAQAILAPYSSTLVQYSEAAQDRWFVGADYGSTGRIWMAGIFAAATIPVSPFYPERYYPIDLPFNLGQVRNRSEPGAARIYSDTVGRYFLLRVPDLGFVDTQGVFVRAATSDGVWYVGTGVSALNTSYLRAFAATAVAVYAAIINAIDRIKGSSIRWQLLVDPNL